MHLPGLAIPAGSLTGVIRPLIARPSGSAVSPRQPGFPLLICRIRHRRFQVVNHPEDIVELKPPLAVSQRTERLQQEVRRPPEAVVVRPGPKFREPACSGCAWLETALFTATRHLRRAGELRPVAVILGHGLAAEDVGDDIGRVGKFGQPSSPRKLRARCDELAGAV